MKRLNKEQLREIWKLLQRIEELLNSDRIGTYELRTKLHELRALVAESLKSVLLQEYLDSLEA